MLRGRQNKRYISQLIKIDEEFWDGPSEFLSQVSNCSYLDFVRFNELCIGIDIVDILVSQRHPVAPVQ